MYCISSGGRIIYVSKTKKLKVLPPKVYSKGSTEVLPEKMYLNITSKSIHYAE